MLSSEDEDTDESYADGDTSSELDDSGSIGIKSSSRSVSTSLPVNLERPEAHELTIVLATSLLN